MSYLITKLDFPEFVPLSVNVADALVNPYIRDAYEFDVKKLLTVAEWALLTSTLAEPTTEEMTPVRVLWAAVRPFWVCQSFRLFLRWHGTHVSSNALESFSDGTNQPVSSARRAELIADIEGRANLYAGQLHAALRLYRGNTATSSCSPARRRPRRGGTQTHAV